MLKKTLDAKYTRPTARKLPCDLRARLACAGSDTDSRSFLFIRVEIEEAAARMLNQEAEALVSCASTQGLASSLVTVTLMKYRCSFSVGLAHDRHRPGDVTLSDIKSFNTIVKSGQGADLVNPWLCHLKCDWADEQLHRVFDTLFRMTGLKPAADGHSSLTQRDKYFHVEVERLPEEDEVKNAPWFYLICPKLTLAKFDSVEPNDSYVVTKVTSKKKIAFGCTDHVGWMMLFSEGLKNQFLDSGLRGIGFNPVKLVNGSPSGLWQISTPERMPPLANPLTDGQGGVFTGDPTKACVVDEGSYHPQILRYRKSDLAEVSDVDVIFSAERIGGGHNAHRMHIVSQRFRQVAEKLAPGQFNYGLVAVGEGEELLKRYTLPELAPPHSSP